VRSFRTTICELFYRLFPFVSVFLPVSGDVAVLASLVVGF